mgnify:CR=1 FL=1
MIVELLGKFYDNHSLSIVNRYLALELDKHIEKVYISPIDSYNPEAKIDADFLDKLEKLPGLQWAVYISKKLFVIALAILIPLFIGLTFVMWITVFLPVGLVLKFIKLVYRLCTSKAKTTKD